MPEADPLARFSDPKLVTALLTKLRAAIPLALAARSPQPTGLPALRFMEVCGTHTMALFESGLRYVLSELGVELISGPGCPVCVTAQADLDYALAIAALPDVTLCTFGDMLRVPGSMYSLDQLKGEGADVRVVYSPHDAVELAGRLPERRVVFLAIGFETTAPGAAYAVKAAAAANLMNFHIFTCLKTIPAALGLLAGDPALKLDGFICPGHVSVVTGKAAYSAVAEEFHKPCVITGFDPVDLMRGILALTQQVAGGEARVENAYSRVVRDAGNPAALALIAEIFEPCDAQWRGLGVIPGSGLRLREAYRRFDARTLLPQFSAPPPDPRLAACRCGEVLKGLIRPDECACFAAACTPEHPLGACMVSQEGACRAYLRYGAWEHAR